MTDKRGPLFAIGGHEDKEGSRSILGAVAERLGDCSGDGTLVIATIASHTRDGYFDAYREGFAPLGTTKLAELYLSEREEAFGAEPAALIENASGIFFTGGDQARLLGHVAGTPIEEAIRALHRRGGLIAGTSAGASAQGGTMMVAGKGEESHRIGDLELAPGLGLVPGAIIDQHFAERGRIGRLLGAIAYRPDLIGIGIDEDTALQFDGELAEVVGSGGVTIVDASRASHSNAGHAEEKEVLSLHGVIIHALSAGDRFDLAARRPAAA